MYLGKSVAKLYKNKFGFTFLKKVVIRDLSVWSSEVERILG